MRVHLIYILIIACVIVNGCKSHISPEEDTPEIINRFDLAVLDYPTFDSEARQKFINRYNDVIILLPSIESQSDSSLVKYSNSRGVRQFTADIVTKFTMQDSIDPILYHIIKNLQNTLPATKDRKVYGIVSTYNQSIILNDSTLLLGLNHYLGNDYPGYEYFDRYLRHTKTPAHLPYDFTEAIIKSDYPYQPTVEQPDLLSRMLYEGAVLYIIQTIMPQSHEEEVLGYTMADFEWLQKNEKEIWKELVEHRLLYSTDPMIATRLIDPAPHSSILTHDAPGRAARYIGYRIIAAYMEHNSSTSLEGLLSPKFYCSFSTLLNAAYNP